MRDNVEAETPVSSATAMYLTRLNPESNVWQKVALAKVEQGTATLTWKAKRAGHETFRVELRHPVGRAARLAGAPPGRLRINPVRLGEDLSAGSDERIPPL